MTNSKTFNNNKLFGKNTCLRYHIFYSIPHILYLLRLTVGAYLDLEHFETINILSSLHKNESIQHQCGKINGKSVSYH